MAERDFDLDDGAVYMEDVEKLIKGEPLDSDDEGEDDEEVAEEATEEDTDEGESEDPDEGGDEDEGEEPEDDDADDEPESETEPEAAEAKTEDKDAREADLRAVRLERAQAEAEHFRKAHDELTGKYGKAVQRQRELEQRLERLEREGGQEYDSGSSDELEKLRLKVEQLERGRREEPVVTAEQVIQQEAFAFTQNERFKGDYRNFEKEIRDALEKNWDSVAQAADNGDIEGARIRMRSILRDAYYDAKESKIAGLKAEQAKVKTVERSRLKGKKRRAQPSGAGSKTSARDDFDPESLQGQAWDRWWENPKVLEKIEKGLKKAGR